MTALLLAAAWLLGASVPAVAGLEAGLEAFYGEDFPRALRELAAPARAGDPVAQRF